MGTDNLHHKRKRDKVSRERKIREIGEISWLIVSEGTKTEPNYFKSIESFCKKKFPREFKIQFNIRGEGKNTRSLISSVDDYLNEITGYQRSANKPYAAIFVIFDKDSFKPDDFDNAIHQSLEKGYIPIWSNECFELWYLLHFNYFNVNIGRKSYNNKLNDYLVEEYKKKYEKNNTQMFNYCG